MALRCLSKFASAITLKRELAVSIKSARNKAFEQVLHVNDSNKDVNQRIMVGLKV